MPKYTAIIKVTNKENEILNDLHKTAGMSKVKMCRQIFMTGFANAQKEILNPKATKAKTKQVSKVEGEPMFIIKDAQEHNQEEFNKWQEEKERKARRDNANSQIPVANPIIDEDISEDTESVSDSGNSKDNDDDELGYDLI